MTQDATVSACHGTITITSMAYVFFLLLFTNSAAKAMDSTVPHVDSCNFCLSCIADSHDIPGLPDIGDSMTTSISQPTTTTASQSAAGTPATNSAVAGPTTADLRTLLQTDAVHQQDSALVGVNDGTQGASQTHMSLSKVTQQSVQGFQRRTTITARRRSNGGLQAGAQAGMAHGGQQRFPWLGRRHSSGRGVGNNGFRGAVGEGGRSWDGARAREGHMAGGVVVEKWPAGIRRVLQGAELGEDGTVARLIQGDDRDRSHLPNCTVCRGCNAILKDISTQVHEFMPRVRFMHRPGFSATWTMLAQPYGSTQQYVVKVFCIPFRKSDSPAPHETMSSHQRFQQQQANQEAQGHSKTGKAAPGTDKVDMSKVQIRCPVKTYEARVRSLLAQQEVMEGCGASEMSPKVWVAPLSAVLPGIGYPVRTWALWSEMARGITLSGLAMAQADHLTQELLGKRMNRTQVFMAGFLDLLTAQCDRHSDNVFIDTEGNLQVIDNDKALGAVPGCGYDSILLPGSRYHSYLRIGPNNPFTTWYRRHSSSQDVCHGPVNPISLVDYRCGVVSTEDGGPRYQLNTSYPAPLYRCLSQLAAMRVDDVRVKYGLTDVLAAKVLHRRATGTGGRAHTINNEGGLSRAGGLSLCHDISNHRPAYYDVERQRLELELYPEVLTVIQKLYFVFRYDHTRV